MRITHAPTGILGHAAMLARAESDLGAISQSIVTVPSPFGHAGGIRAPVSYTPLGFMKSVRLAKEVISNSDVLHYNFASSLLPARTDVAVTTRRPMVLRHLFNLVAGFTELEDIKWAHSAGKVVAVTFMGDDIRSGKFCRDQFPDHPAHDTRLTYYSEQSDRLRQERLRKFLSVADVLFSLNPDLMHMLPSNTVFLPYAHIDVPNIEPCSYALGSSTPIRIVHAPTNRIVKGTDAVIGAIQQLQSEGVACELELIEGRSQQDAMKAYACADIVVDQLRIGWYGGLAVEAMALGRAVVSFLREADLRFVPSSMQDGIPIVCADMASITDVLRELCLGGRENLYYRGLKCREFALKWHTPRSVAAITLGAYEAAARARHPTVSRHR